MKQIDVDIIIAGAGLVGLAAAISFTELGKKVALIEAKKPSPKSMTAWDERVYALTPGTEDWLQSLGVDAFIDKTRENKIDAIHLWNERDDTPLILSADDANLAKLGSILENQNLLNAFRRKMDTLDVITIMGDPCSIIHHDEKKIRLQLESGLCLSASLLVAADGANSFVRRYLGIATKTKDFNQMAIVANFKAEKNHGNVARQWFSPHSTLALLPLPKQYVSMVWSLSTEKAAHLLTLTGNELEKSVESESNGVLGGLKLVSKAVSFRLMQITALQLATQRVVLVGDAAHQVHPMAGQGMNLGFRDVAALQKLINGAHGLQDIGEKVFLRRYERARKADIVGMNSLTTSLDYLFASQSKSIKNLRSWGMQQINNWPAIKAVLIKQAAA